MNQSIENNHVQNIVHFEECCKAIVQNLVQIRTDAGISQKLIAELINEDRRKIIAIENLTNIDFKVLLKYADKLDIEINLNYQLH